MPVLNVGSLNVDHVYRVPHFVTPGETIAGDSYDRLAGGKGLNQSVALGLAGAAVHHTGIVGLDGTFLVERLRSANVNTDLVTIDAEMPSGHARIEVIPAGQNRIILHPGTNHLIGEAHIDRALHTMQAGDWLVTQNETSGVAYLLTAAKKRGLTVVFNPAPMTIEVSSFPLEAVDYLIVNEGEGSSLTGQREPDCILDTLIARYPATTSILTLGERGARYVQNGKKGFVPAVTVTAVDTTAAGDTFTGYMVYELSEGRPLEEALRVAGRAAAVCVTRYGAADSIPARSELGL